MLIVDDSPDIRELWRLWLTFWGFETQEAQNGLQAVQQAQRLRPDLILMDLWMPVLDGLSATERLKADPGTADVPVLAVSAVLPDAAESAMAAGCEKLLLKPLDPDELLEQIRAVFARRARRGE